MLLHLRKSFNQYKTFSNFYGTTIRVFSMRYSKDAQVIQQELQRRGKPLHSQPETHPTELLYNFGLQMVKNAAVDSLVGISKNSSQQIFQAERVTNYISKSQFDTAFNPLMSDPKSTQMFCFFAILEGNDFFAFSKSILKNA